MSSILSVVPSSLYPENVFNLTTRNSNLVSRQLKYYFTNSWFVAFDIPEEKSKLWNEEQRVMYMRLRRIVISHSEMTMEYNQYKRETMIRTKPMSRIRKPINSVYTGYGEVGEKFFYYGVMNQGAYLNKFDVDDTEQENDLFDIPFLGKCCGVQIMLILILIYS